MLVKEISPFKLKLFKIREKISPASAGRKGVKIWLTPPKYETTNSQKEVLASAKTTRAPFSESSYQSGSDAYYTMHSWGAGKKVLVLHDWGGAAAQVSSIVKPLVQAGYQVIAPDTLAHGAASGKYTDINEMLKVIMDIGRHHDNIEAIIAHGWSAIATVMAISDGLKCNHLIVSNTATSIEFYLHRFAKLFSATRETMGRISATMNSVLNRSLKDFSISNTASGLGQPALIVHDMQNLIIPYSEAIALEKMWPGCELHLTKNLGSDGVFTDSAAIGAMTDYLSKVKESDKPDLDNLLIPK